MREEKPNTPEKLTKPYDPGETEGRIYEAWEQSGYFNPDNLPPRQSSGQAPQNGEPYTITLPPPNVTGVLHLGHAYEDSLQDAVIRFQRMRGKRALWVPGTDSAAVATQARVEKNIKKEENKTRHDLGREELVRRVLSFAKESESTILNQVRRMGSSLDWSRYAYTLDEKRNKAVATAFKRMYDAGLIYRGHRIVNWDPKGQTTISDDEVVYKEERGKFYYFKYGPFTIGTARPETKFGDKYVVIHPDDDRYKEYKHGDTLEAEWINGPLTATVIKDKAADPEMGSGVMTITPWHSAVDSELALKHDLDKEQIIDQYGKLLPIAEEFAGMKITDAREKVVEKLDKKGLLVKVDEHYAHNVATSERTGAMIEPQIMEQWFIAVDKPFVIPHSEISGIESGSETTLKALMRTAVESGAVDMPQKGFRSAYFHWIDNLRDWCISRQIWFGHRIPVYYCRNTQESNSKHQETNHKQSPNSNNQNTKLFVSTEKPKTCPDCAACEMKQDEDVLDTWFSSALWTFSTLGWPAFAKTATAGKPGPENDLANYHPTSLMSPAYEILSLWVSRMILMSGFHLGQAPFKKVLIHGLVKDKHGRKFSKSLGNGVDPIEMIDKYGADALRMGLLAGTAIGNDINFDENKVRGYKHFANKLWNITRFVLENTQDAPKEKPALDQDTDVWLEGLEQMKGKATNHLEEYNIHLAIEEIYQWTWYQFADKCLEESKKIFESGTEEEIAERKRFLVFALADITKLLHPFMPFVTEEIWSMLPEHAKEHDVLMVAEWPSR